MMRCDTCPERSDGLCSGYKYHILGAGNWPDCDQCTLYFEYKGKKYNISERELIDAWMTVHKEGEQTE